MRLVPASLGDKGRFLESGFRDSEIRSVLIRELCDRDLGMIPSVSDDAAFEAWVAALEARQLEELRFPEVRKGVQALSSLYVERRERLGAAVFDGAGKRAAFALYYAPLHFLAVRAVVRGLNAASPPPERIADLGCGTGAGGAAWAAEAGGSPRVDGWERSGWAAEEARRTLVSFGLAGRIRTGDLLGADLRGERDAVLLAFTVNELPKRARDGLLQRLIAAGARGARVLVLEPIATRLSPWWAGWRAAFEEAGGRADEWKVASPLPPVLQLLDKASGLDHRVLSARSLWL